MSLALLLLLSCGAQPPAGPAARYVQAAASGEPGACAAIEDPVLEGECLVFSLAAVVEAEGVDGGRALCEQVPEGVWGGECWFQLSDAVRASGELAKGLCSRAAPFQAQCLSHVVARDSKDVLADTPPGQEAEALERLRAVAVDYLGRTMGTAKARQIMRKALAARFRDRPFHPDGCGNIGPSMCIEVYRELVSFAAATNGEASEKPGEKAIVRVCNDGASLELVKVAGLPVWEPEGEEIALAAWGDLCQRKRQLIPRQRGKARPGLRPQRRLGGPPPGAPQGEASEQR